MCKDGYGIGKEGLDGIVINEGCDLQLAFSTRMCNYWEKQNAFTSIRDDASVKIKLR